MTAGGLNPTEDLLGVLRARVWKHHGTIEAKYYQDAIDEIVRLIALVNGKATDAPDKRVVGGAVPPTRTNSEGDHG